MPHRQMKARRLNISSKFDSIILGDNPFFGIDHLSYERGRQRTAQQNFDNAINVIKCSYELGVKDMMVGTRPMLPDLLEHLRKKTNLLENIRFHAVLPYAQDYVVKMSEKGLIQTIKDVLNSAGLGNKIKILTRGGLGFIRKDLSDLLKALIDVELLKLNNLKIKTVFLHPVLTDLALALNMKGAFETFIEHLHDNYAVNGGLCTKNFPRLVDKLLDWNLKIFDIMTSFNKVGFLMNPSREECEKYLTDYNGTVTGMNIFAGGYLGLQDAYDYVISQTKLRNVVVGVSSIEHAKQTFQLFVR